MTDAAGEGTIINTSFNFIYSLPINIGDIITIRLGTQASYVKKIVDWSKLRFGDQIDPRRGWIYQTQEQQGKDIVLYPDFSAGVLLNTVKIENTFSLQGGIAVHHITEPDESFFSSTDTSRLPRKYSVHGGFTYYLRSDSVGDVSITPLFLFQMQQEFMQLNLGLTFQRKKGFIGTYYRNGDSFILFAGTEILGVRFAYSYDATFSKLGNPKDGTHGAHEISWGCVIKHKKKKLKFHPALIPGF